MRTLKERRVVTRHPLRMAIWTNEEDGFTDSVSRPANCSRATWPASIAGSPWQTAFANSAAIQPGWTRPGFLQEKIEAAAAELGLKTMRLPSGGGHDAQMIAKVAPICMTFSPQRRWHQHSPKEFTRWEDCANVLLQTILMIDRSTSPCCALDGATKP
jgi:hypothetical protein